MYTYYSCRANWKKGTLFRKVYQMMLTNPGTSVKQNVRFRLAIIFAINCEQDLKMIPLILFVSSGII